MPVIRRCRTTGSCGTKHLIKEEAQGAPYKEQQEALVVIQISAVLRHSSAIIDRYKRVGGEAGTCPSTHPSA